MLQQMVVVLTLEEKICLNMIIVTKFNGHDDSDPFKSSTPNLLAPHPFIPIDHFSAAISPANSFSSDPFGLFGAPAANAKNGPFGGGETDSSTSKTPVDMSGKDPFAALQPASNGPPPGPESPSPALLPKKSKQPPPHPTPPPPLQQPTKREAPLPPTPTSFGSSSGAFADSANFNSKLVQLESENTHPRESLRDAENVILDLNIADSEPLDENKLLKEKLNSELENSTQVSFQDMEKSLSEKCREIVELKEQLKQASQRVKDLENEKSDFDMTFKIVEDEHNRRIQELSQSLENEAQEVCETCVKYNSKVKKEVSVQTDNIEDYGKDKCYGSGIVRELQLAIKEIKRLKDLCRMKDQKISNLEKLSKTRTTSTSRDSSEKSSQHFVGKSVPCNIFAVPSKRRFKKKSVEMQTTIHESGSSEKVNEHLKNLCRVGKKRNIEQENAHPWYTSTVTSDHMYPVLKESQRVKKTDSSGVI